MKKASKSTITGPAKAVADTPADMDPKTHTELFASAMRCFSSGDFRKAKHLFDKAADGPVLSVNETAMMYSRMCQQRLARERPELKTTEDHYNFAIGLMNARKFAEAKPHLEAAMDGSDAAHVRYALALVLGMLGDVDGSIGQFRRAFHQDPGLRGLARNDEDVRPLLEYPQFRSLLAGESPVN